MKRSRRYFTKIATAIFAAAVAAAVLFLPGLTFCESVSASGSSSVSGSGSVTMASAISPMMLLKAQKATDEDLAKAEIDYEAKKVALTAEYVAAGKDLGTNSVQKEYERELAATSEANEYYAIYLTKTEKKYPKGEFNYTVENTVEETARYNESFTDFIAQMKMYRIITIVTLAIAGVVFVLSIFRIIFDNVAFRTIGIITSVLLFLVAAGMFAYPFLMDITCVQSGTVLTLYGSSTYTITTSAYCEPGVFALAYPVAGLIAMIFGICSCRRYKNK